MTPTRPYLLRAFFEWILDNEMTPYLLSDVHSDAVLVPLEYVENNRIVLNVSPEAVLDLILDNDALRETVKAFQEMEKWGLGMRIRTVPLDMKDPSEMGFYSVHDLIETARPFEFRDLVLSKLKL